MLLDLFTYIKIAFFAFGIATNSINALIFFHPQMKHISFKYMLSIAISEILYLSIHLCTICINEATQIFWSIAFKVYINEYICRSLLFFIVLAELFLSIQNYMVLLNRPYLKEKSHTWLILCMCIASFLIYIPSPLSRKISPVQPENSTYNVTENRYKLEFNGFGLSLAGKLALIITPIVRLILGSILLPLINIIIALEFRKRFLKSPLHSNSQPRTSSSLEI
jgi:hypothetical protein